MIIKLLLALLLPCLLVILFTRVTYSLLVGTLLTVVLLVASIYQGYTDSVLVGVADVISLAAGYIYSKKMVERYKG